MAEFNSCASLIKDTRMLQELEDQFDGSSDPLQEMLNMQEWLQTTLAEKLPETNIKPSEIATKGQLISWLDSNFDAMMDEYRELKNAVGGMSKGEKSASAVWKKWKSNHVELQGELLVDMPDDDRLEMLFEVIDKLHFFLNILLGVGLTSKDIYVLYFLKNMENRRRYESNY